MDYNFILFFLGGLGMFLFGLNIFEESIKNISSKKFKKIIRNYTNTNLKAIFTGTFSTIVLQSSGVVSLIVLAFVGTGIVSLQNGVGVIIGTNIGAPLSDVILGSIGLKFDTKLISMALMGFSAIGLLIFYNKNIFKNIFKVFFGLGLIFLGLSYIKGGVMDVSSVFDFETYKNVSIYIYFLIGLLLTFLMQSSSAMIIITLALASAGIINFDMGISLILGAYLGTTFTAVIGSIGGKQIKKQVAFFHVFFNLILVFIGFILFKNIRYLLLDVFELKNDIILSLSIFAVGFKIFGAIIMYPFIGRIVYFLKLLIPEKHTEFGLDIEKIDTNMLDIGIIAMKKDSVRLIKRVFRYNMNVFDIDEQKILDKKFKLNEIIGKEKEFDDDVLDNEYKSIKTIEEKIIKYGLDVKENIDQNYSIKINEIYNIVGNVVYSAKYMKDIKLNIQSIQESENEFIRKKYNDFRMVLVGLYRGLSQIIDGVDNKEIFEQIINSLDYIKNNDSRFLSAISKDIINQKMDEFELSGLININRYIYLSSISMISAVRDLFLEEKEKKFLERINT